MGEEVETFTVFLKNPKHAENKRVAQALAGIRGVTVIDVRKHLRACCGVVAEKLNERKALALGEFLNKQGFPTVVFPDADVLRFPPPILVDRGRRLGDGISFRTDERVGEMPQGSWIEIKWENLIYMAWARVRETERYRTSDVETRYAADRGLGMMGAYAVGYGAAGAASRSHHVVHKTGERQVKNQYLDFFAIHPATHLRINPQEFAYATVLPKLKRTSHENLMALVAMLGTCAERVLLDPSIRDLMDGNPRTNLDLPSPRAYEFYLLWNVQMSFREGT